MLRSVGVVLLAAGVLYTGSATALENPVARYPSSHNLADNYPARAAEAHVEGWAKVQCTVQATGRLADCVVLAEGPQGWGFGAAAVKTLTETGTVDLNRNRPGKRVTLTPRFTLGD